MKLSVIVPICNMEKFLVRAITCMKAQDEASLEFLLINDGSTDRSLDLAEEFCGRDARFRIFSMANRGYGHACNFGFSMARGEYAAIYEPDDCLSPDFYSTLLRTAELCPRADIIKYNGIWCLENGVQRSLFHWEKEMTGKLLDRDSFSRFWRSHPSVFNGIYRKRFLRENGVVFCETRGASFQDAMFSVSLYYAAPLLFAVDDKKYVYALHEGQSIRDCDEKTDCVMEAWDLEKKWLLARGCTNLDFYLSCVFTQMESLRNRVSKENRTRLLSRFRQLRAESKRFNTALPSLSQRLRYALL